MLFDYTHYARRIHPYLHHLRLLGRVETEHRAPNLSPSLACPRQVLGSVGDPRCRSVYLFAVTFAADEGSVRQTLPRRQMDFPLRITTIRGST
jgi:hypothetical protein